MSSGPSDWNEKPRSALIDLHGGDADIEHDAVDRRDTLLGGRLTQLGKSAIRAAFRRSPNASLSAWPAKIAEGSRSSASTLQAAGFKNGARVAAGAEGRVYVGGAIVRV